MDLPYRDRISAGRALATDLAPYRGRADVLVLGLPRGGVPVAVEIARALEAELDILVVRKLGLPGQEELAMGAIASGGVCLQNAKVVQMADVSEEAFERVEQRERMELRRREEVFRGERPLPKIEGRCVILVDDGLATGSTMRAAIAAVRQEDASRVVVAVPVAPAHTVSVIGEEADEVVCPATPRGFLAIGQFYEDFSQVDDEEVRAQLEAAWEKSKNTV